MYEHAYEGWGMDGPRLVAFIGISRTMHALPQIRHPMLERLARKTPYYKRNEASRAWSASNLGLT